MRDLTLTNQQATPKAIQEGLEALSGRDANDLAVIFLAGHGVKAQDGRFWFMTREGRFFKGGASGVMVFSASKGRQQSRESPDIGGGFGVFT